MKVRQNTGSRKYVITMLGLGAGFVLALTAFVLAARALLTSEYVKVIEAFAGMVAVALGSFAVGNAVEHYSKRGKDDPQ